MRRFFVIGSNLSFSQENVQICTYFLLKVVLYLFKFIYITFCFNFWTVPRMFILFLWSPKVLFFRMHNHFVSTFDYRTAFKTLSTPQNIPVLRIQCRVIVFIASPNVLRSSAVFDFTPTLVPVAAVAFAFFAANDRTTRNNERPANLIL